MLNKLQNTWAMMMASWELLKEDGEIMVYSFISILSCVAVTASFLIPVFYSGQLDLVSPENNGDFFLYSLIFFFYVVNYFVINFFNSAIVATVQIRMSGGDPKFMDGLNVAFSKVHLILGWSLVAATVGFLIRMLEERVGWLGKILLSFVGVAWTMASYFVVPIMVAENLGPIESLKRSAGLLRRTWGEQLISGFSYGIIFFIFAIPAILGIAAGSAMGSSLVGYFMLGLGVLYLFVLSQIQSALVMIFQTALYRFARDGKAPRGYDDWMLKQAIQRKIDQ
ncbi:MAG: DUF6159 family protein [Calditrichia bacterium]